MDATECDTQPIPVIRDDWSDEHASAMAESFAPVTDRPRAPAPVGGADRTGTDRTTPDRTGTAGGRSRRTGERRDIVDETDDRDGHVIYVDPYAWDRD
jgi:hypothetical protein